MSAPLRIERVEGLRATARVGSRTVVLSSAATPEVGPGDWVLVSGGVIVRQLDPDRAAEIVAALDTLKGEAT